MNLLGARNLLVVAALVLGGWAFVDHKGDVAECAAKGQQRALLGCVDR